MLSKPLERDKRLDWEVVHKELEMLVLQDCEQSLKNCEIYKGRFQKACYVARVVIEYLIADCNVRMCEDLVNVIYAFLQPKGIQFQKMDSTDRAYALVGGEGNNKVITIKQYSMCYANCADEYLITMTIDHNIQMNYDYWNREVFKIGSYEITDVQLSKMEIIRLSKSMPQILQCKCPHHYSLTSGYFKKATISIHLFELQHLETCRWMAGESLSLR